MRIVCDTNVIISALIFPGGVPDKIVHGIFLGSFKNFTSPDLLTEVRRVLHIKFSLPARELESILSPLIQYSQCVYPTERIHVIAADESDNRVLECAQAAQAQYIITGDKKHLLPLKKFGRTEILSPHAFALMSGLL